MKRQFRSLIQQLRVPPRLRWSDFLWTILPALIWYSLLLARPTTIQPYCAARPELCTRESVLALDRISLGIQSAEADRLSFMTQDSSGYIAFGTPLVLSLGAAVLGRMNPMLALARLGTDFTLVLQSVLWNGAIKEATHAISQRARPFVYSDPVRLGGDPAHYTSFYSGHTSFAAACCVAWLLILLGRGATIRILLPASVIAVFLTVSTGAFRVLAARHFITDVVIGALAGGLVALAVALLHRRSGMDRAA